MCENVAFVANLWAAEILTQRLMFHSVGVNFTLSRQIIVRLGFDMQLPHMCLV